MGTEERDERRAQFIGLKPVDHVTHVADFGQLIALQMGITPLLAFWIATANQFLRVDSRILREVLSNYFAGHQKVSAAHEGRF